MGMLFGGGPKPPPPPPPPPNAPTYASTFNAPPATGSTAPLGLFQGAMSANPLGPMDQRATQRKQLFG
jgi:hypothetical protein